MLHPTATAQRGFASSATEEGDRTPEVLAATNNLNHQIAVLQERVERLAQRLEPVLSSSIPPDKENGLLASHSSPLAEAIRNEAVRVEAASARVYDLLSRLEI